MRKHNVYTDNGSLSVFVNVDDVAVTFGSPYVVNGVAYEGTIYVRKNHAGVWQLGQSFVNRVDDWTRTPTDAAWEVMFATAKNLAEDFYTTENVKQAKRELLEYEIESVERKMSYLEDKLAQLKSDLRSL